jgi:hypothetical protein
VSLISARGGSQWSSEGDVRLVHLNKHGVSTLLVETASNDTYHVASAEVTSTALAIKLGVEVRVERGGKERTGVGSGTRIDWMCSEVVIVHNTSGNRSSQKHRKIRTEKCPLIFT